MQKQAVTVSTPGRICLFGEHQDYLGLPVIAAAISCRIQVQAESISQPLVRLHLPDIGRDEQFGLTPLPLTYLHDRDYFRSAVNVMAKAGFRFSHGIEGAVRGQIPINAGTSSSSALLVSWLNVLSQLADNPQPLSPQQLAELAYEAEVLEFGEPGGMMDHYSTAVGGVVYLESKPAIRLEAYQPRLGTFVLGDSGEPKDTIGILSRVKFGMLRIVNELTRLDPVFSLPTADVGALAAYKNRLSPDDYTLLVGNLANRDILRQALTLIRATPSATPFDDRRFGQLLTEHHANLRDAQRISTPKIDRMLDAALSAGALGGKINGSGGGGCMFAYAPINPEPVAEAIRQAGGRAYIVSVDEGTTRISQATTHERPATLV
ncbi:galactokinase [Fibrella aestuarina BUZ 2]|uniref:Galactokinase n=1 Tax=Fibrella aestuarina BUZ 2 TaxID=1166018 RepID=I0K3D3_9BACT|nr:galactokinase family protein [Fibrella aestuarina]CCG98636.1 galactokinase [Fibrella aestuarina BUZ 2]